MLRIFGVFNVNKMEQEDIIISMTYAQILFNNDKGYLEFLTSILDEENTL
ncbi:hypothetical protein [Clostridium tepidiprofundi]|nr:hypothetical protein [Clostridium tepidiprofundi]